MVVFTQKINGVTGVLEWDVKDDTYDYHQEIARAAFADMLHDTERNQKYLAGLKAAIEKMHSLGRPANVLDIGTGTGLLSMMAAQCGADSIVACEAFQPMSECAKRIIKDNGCEGLIKIIPKHSTDITVGEDGDMCKRANILVTEVFDTELIGEGAIQTFRHAHDKLLEKDSIVVPHAATVYAQVVESPTLQKWNKLNDVANEDGEIIVKTPNEVKECSGSAAVHDIQLSQVEQNLFKAITKPIPVFHYDWSGKKPLLKNNLSSHDAKVLATGNAQMVFMWWDLEMDTEGKVLLSCAPWWCHPDADSSVQYPQHTIPWRDHWMQAIYYFPKPILVHQGEFVKLISSHDEYSLWFNITKSHVALSLPHDVSKRPVCTCGLHMTYSRTHVSYMNDSIRNKKVLRVLGEMIDNDSTLLCLNGSSVLGLAAAKMGAKKIIYVESSITGKRILKNYVMFNKLENVEIYENIESVMEIQDHKDNISIIFGDPDYATSLLPWDNLRLAHSIHKYKAMLKKGFKVIPGKCTLWTMAVEFLDLHKIKAPLDVCEKIDMKIFDELISNSRRVSDDEIEAQPLWEYPCLCRSEPIQILNVDLHNTQDFLTSSGSNIFKNTDAVYNGFVFWLEWNLNESLDNVVNSGPINEPTLNGRISWDPHTRQGVKLLEKSCCVNENESIEFNVKCNLLYGTIHIDVNVK